MWRYLFLLPAYLLATSLPLASQVGANLEYEYALLASYFGLLLIPAAGLLLPTKRLPLENGVYNVPVALEVFWILFISPLIGLAAGFYLFATGFCPCSVSGFGFWMVVVWYPSWILAHAIYHGVLRLRTKGFSRWKISAGVVLAYAAIISLAFVQLWIFPQKRITNLVLGFIHGPIYDDWIAFDAGLLLARSAHFAAALVLLSIAWFKKSKVGIVSLTVLAATWIVLGVLAGQFPSTQNSRQDLDKLLNATLRGEGFTLHYRAPPIPPIGPATAMAPAPKKSHVPVGIQRLFRDAQFEVKELTALLGGDGTKLPLVQIYVYPNDDRKKLWFGGGSTDVTDVRTPSVHISLGTWPHPTLRHELVHALASGFGFHGLGFHPNMAFTEGLAVALAPQSQNLTLDEGAASLIDTGRLPKVEKLFSPSFWEVSGDRAYTVAGSLLRYMIEKYGIKSVKELYAGKSWTDAIGQDQQAVIQAWKEQITKGYDKEKNAIYSEALYRYPGVLADLCPHSKADLARNRNESVYTRTRQPIGWDPDADYQNWLLKLDPKDQEPRLRVWRREIRRVALDRFPPEGRLGTWREALHRARSMPPKTLEDVDMAITESDVAKLMGDTEGSIKILQELGELEKTHYFGEASRREVATRLKIEAGAGGSLILEWRRYLAGWRKSLPENVLGQGPWLTTYLKLRNDKDVKPAPEELMRLLHEAKPDPELPGTFAFEWYKLIANRMMHSGHFKEAADAYKRAADSAAPGTVEVYREHARRAAFYGQAGAQAPSGDEDDTEKS